MAENEVKQGKNNPDQGWKTPNSYTTTNSNKRSRFFAIFAHDTIISSFPEKAMLITINNSLPSIRQYIAILENDENRMRILADTDAAMKKKKYKLTCG